MTSHQQPKRKIIVLDGRPEQYRELAVSLLRMEMAEPDFRDLVEDLATNEDVETAEFFSTAFALGVASAVNAMREGMIKTFPKE